ncbi:hypothetical protein ACFQQB_62945 [Nonomuraea rubra]|uniref:hypothetical protein n=1 Tax=Nonomuraea rubra TaxID=46180 RepID=UPI00361CF27B
MTATHDHASAHPEIATSEGAAGSGVVRCSRCCVQSGPGSPPPSSAGCSTRGSRSRRRCSARPSSAGR